MKVDTGSEVIEFPDSMQRDEIRAALVKRNNSDVVGTMRKVARVETGGEKDSFIRAHSKNSPPEGSTAYGPLQVTLTLAQDYKDRKSDLFDEEELSYLDRFIEQGVQFKEYGREPEKEGYDPKYDYSGGGDLGKGADRDMYWQVFSKLFNDRVGGDLSSENVAKMWHGGTDEKKIKAYAGKLDASGM